MSDLKWPCIALLGLFLVMGIDHYCQEKTKQEAIRHGLAQDSEGNWVKPSTQREETSP